MTTKDEIFYRGKLFAASWRGEFDNVKEVIEARVVSVNVVDSDGVSALRYQNMTSRGMEYTFIHKSLHE